MNVGNRYTRIAIGWCVGCAVGLTVGLPFMIWAKLPPDIKPGSDHAEAIKRSEFATLMVTTVFCGAAGAGLVGLMTGLPGVWLRVVRYSGIGALCGACFAGLLFLVVKPIDKEFINPWINAAFVALLAGLGALNGLLYFAVTEEKRQKEARSGLGVIAPKAMNRDDLRILHRDDGRPPYDPHR